MTKMIVRCLQEDLNGVLLAEPAREAFIDGYAVADRLLEGIPIRIFRAQSGALDVQVCIAPSLAKQMFVDIEQVRKKVSERIEGGEFDLLSSSRKLSDNDMLIYDDALPTDQQAFNASPAFSIRKPD